MKALLLSMPDIYPEWLPLDVKCPNLALASLAGNCPNHQVYVGDLILKRRDVKGAIRKALRDYNPQLIGLSAMTFQFPTLVKIAQFIKRLNPSIPVVIGGYHATVLYQQIAEAPEAEYIDFIMRGESDLAFHELLNECESAHKFERIQGLSYKTNGTWIHNPARPVENINHIRLPDRNARIWDGYHIFNEPFDTIETSRGCLNHCKFCSIKQMYGHSRREYAIDRVIQDIKNARVSGTKYLLFIDDNLTNDVRGFKRFEQLLDAIVANKLNDLKYATQASSISMGSDAQLVKKMRAAGFDMVFLGIENTSARNLAYYKKGNITDYTKRAITFLKANDMIIVGGLVQGMEEDREEDFKRNIEYLMETEIDIILGQILTPYPGTQLREELLHKELVTNPDNWTTYSGYFANVKTRHLSTEDLNFLQWKYLRHYHHWRNRHFWKLRIFRKHPLYVIQTIFFKRIFKYFPLFMKRLGKDDRQKFRISLEYNLNLNRNVI